jgi:Uma2 family endonuclease
VRTRHAILDNVSLSRDFIPVPHIARLPIELRMPRDFRPDDPATWPEAVGRLEYVGSRLLYMPPRGDVQQDVAVTLAMIVGNWAATRVGFAVGGNEAGMILGEDVRGADLAVWRKSDVVPHTGGYRRVPPLLAIEVTGQDEDQEALAEKVEWYLAHGVATVWVVVPTSREVVVFMPGSHARCRAGDWLPEPAGLPGLSPAVTDLFAQIE